LLKNISAVKPMVVLLIHRVVNKDDILNASILDNVCEKMIVVYRYIYEFIIFR